MEPSVYMSYMALVVRTIALSVALRKRTQLRTRKCFRNRRYKGRGKWKNSIIWTSYQEQLALLRVDNSADFSFENLPTNYQALGDLGTVQFLKDAEDVQACFRLRYRLSHGQFEKLMVSIREKLDLNEGSDCTGRRETVAPLELKSSVCSSNAGKRLRSGRPSADEWNRSLYAEHLFRTFCAKFSALYDSFIDVLGTAAAVADTYEYLPGCLGSVDGVHLWWDRVPFHLRNQYKGFKSYPSVSFGVTVNHAGRILSLTKGFQGSKNDKTVVRYDGFIKKLKENPFFTSNTFELFNLQGNPVIHSGIYLICDNGYHNWRVLQCPISMASGFWDRQYSRYIESQRKDIECVFGRLKTRFLILKHPIRVLKHETVENIFFTCCILHNFILANGESEKEVQWLESERLRIDAEQSCVPAGNTNTNERLSMDDRTMPKPQIVLALEKNEGDTEQEIDFFKLRTSLLNHFRHLVETKKLKWVSTAPNAYRDEIAGTE